MRSVRGSGYAAHSDDGSRKQRGEMNLPEKIILAGITVALTDAWAEAFAAHEQVEVYAGDFFSRDADAMVSPANSFGIMDGGLDAAIRAALGGPVESAVQSIIVEKHHGELPVGAAEIVSTGHGRWPYLIAAPTMRIPENVGNTVNAYLAFRAVLLMVKQHNLSNPNRPIRTILVPGLGTGIGGMAPRRCAAQMRIAYDQVSKPARIPSFSMIHELHHKLRSAV